MRETQIDKVLKKLKTNEELTADDKSMIYSKLNPIFGEDANDEIFEVEYPLNLIQCLFGNSNLIKTSQKEIDKIKDNLDYVFDNYMQAREVKVIELRFKNHLSLSEVGEQMCVTRERVRQIESRALRRLRHSKMINLIFTPRELSKEIEKREKVLVERKEELGQLIIKTVDQIKILQEALQKVDVKTDINIDLSVTEKPLDEFGLSVRCFNCLKRAGINTIGDLTRRTMNDMTKVRNLGRHSLEEARSLLITLGLDFAQEKEEIPGPIYASEPEVKDISDGFDDEAEECDDYGLCESCASFKGPNNKCRSGYWCTTKVEGCKDYYRHPFY